jgi:hypothetical protein
MEACASENRVYAASSTTYQALATTTAAAAVAGNGLEIRSTL